MKQHFNTYEEKIIYEKLKSIEETVRIQENDDLYLVEEKIRHISNNIEKMQKASCFDYYSPITSGKKRIGWIVVKVKTFIRKIVAFIFAPLLAQQAEYNTYSSASTSAMTEIFKLEIQESRKVKKALEELLECMRNLTEKKAREQHEELVRKTNFINKRLDRIEEKLNMILEKAGRETF